MKMIIKGIIIAVLIIAIISLLVLYSLLIKPNADIKKNHDSFSISTYSGEGDDKIHFLSTGSSDAILLESNGQFALVDCGEDTDNPRNFPDLEFVGYEDMILDYLMTNAKSKDGKVYLDFVIGTHAHSDHIGGFDTIINSDNVVVKRAYLKEYDESKITENEVVEWDNKEVYEQMINALNNKNVPIISNIEDKSFKLGDFNITLFNTEYDNSGILVGENDNAIGTLVEKNGAKVFLAADINNINGDEERLMDDIGKVDILKVGHHSYSKSTSTPWLKTLSPSVCIVTNEEEKTDKRTLRRITRVAKSPILTTGGENGVIATIDDNGNINYYNNIHNDLFFSK